MALEIQVPCDGDGVCMRCKVTPPAEESLTCSTCVTPWHVPCLLPESLVSSTGEWLCPDCSGDADSSVPVSGIASGSDLVAAIRAIEADVTLSEAEKAKKRQELMSGCGGGDDGLDDEEDEKKKSLDNDVLKAVYCSICIQLPERPVTVRSFSSILQNQ